MAASESQDDGDGDAIPSTQLTGEIVSITRDTLGEIIKAVVAKGVEEGIILSCSRYDSDSSQEKARIPKAPHYKCETLTLDPTHLEVELWRSEIRGTNSIVKKLPSDQRILIN